MADALRNADLRNLFVTAKQFAGRARVFRLGSIASAFAARFADMEVDAREQLRGEYPGVPERKYASGWMGQWDRMADGDADVGAGDTSLASRTMVRYVKFTPVAEELVRRDRLDAVPVKLSTTCSALQRALVRITPVHARPPPPGETRARMIDAVADAFLEVTDTADGPRRNTAAFWSALDESIVRYCRRNDLDIGEPPAPRPAKRPRQTATTPATASVAGTSDADAPDVGADSTADQCLINTAARDTASANEDTSIDAYVASLVDDRKVARKVLDRLRTMVPEVARVVADDIAPEIEDSQRIS